MVYLEGKERNFRLPLLTKIEYQRKLTITRFLKYYRYEILYKIQGCRLTSFMSEYKLGTKPVTQEIPLSQTIGHIKRRNQIFT